MSKRIFVAAIAAVVLCVSSVAFADWQIPVDYKTMVLSCATEAKIYIAFNNTFLDTIGDCDASSWAYVDLGAKYNLTKILFGGRKGNTFDQRIRKGKFIVSEDATTWTTITNVPSDFVQQDQPNATNTLELAALNLPRYRYVGWKDVTQGSINEVQWWTDDRMILPSGMPAFDEADATGATMALKLKRVGDFAAGEKISVTVYKSATDHGSDPADWTAADDFASQNLGAFDEGGQISEYVTGIDGETTTSIRLLLTCDGTSSFTDDGWSFDIDANPIKYTEWRPLVDSSACVPSGWRQWNKDDQWRLFDNDESTAGKQAVNVVDYGRPVRVDRVRFVTTGAAGWPVQGSMDGWTWTTITNRVVSDPLAVSLPLPAPQVYRYFRVYYEATPAAASAINEVRLYSQTNAPYVAVNDEAVVSRRRAGITLTGTVFSGGTNEIASVALKAWIGDQDYGPDAAKWLAAGVTAVDCGSFAPGATYTVGPLVGSSGKIQYVRLQAVASVTDCADGFGTAHAFTMADEYQIDVSVENISEMVNTTWGKNYNTTVLNSIYNFNFNHDIDTDIKQDLNPWGAVLPKYTRLTRMEWVPRYSVSCNARARNAKYFVSESETTPADADSSWTQVGSGSTPSPGWCNQWNQIYIGRRARHFKQKGDNNGNERVRLWAEDLKGLTLLVR